MYTESRSKLQVPDASTCPRTPHLASLATLSAYVNTWAATPLWAISTTCGRVSAPGARHPAVPYRLGDPGKLIGDKSGNCRRHRSSIKAVRCLYQGEWSAPFTHEECRRGCDCNRAFAWERALLPRNREISLRIAGAGRKSKEGRRGDTRSVEGRLRGGTVGSPSRRNCLR